MQTLNTFRWCCTYRSYQNANVFRKCIVKTLPTSSNAVLNSDFTLNNTHVTGIRGLCNRTSKLLGRFNVNQAAVYPNQLRTFCTVSKRCWKCKSAIQAALAFFCPACKVIQAPDEHANYFDIMDCDKTFTLDTQKLQRRYLHLQRSLHPDNFSQKTQKEQEYSETQSALVNKAYRTLLKPLSRGLYMLELGGVPVEEGTDIGADQQLLLEILEINERLQETQIKEETDSIGVFIEGRLQDLTEKIDVSFHQGDIQSAKVLIAQMKYFANIQEKVKEKLSAMLV
ncbi:hypothetical protein ANANG_G00188390 [Anguilla anguilla]|uniref:Iron-sulfur cluster co-chaperone protein HscB n=1 Tax=Anguilla anguilla TaxID=7936 RepID=A0A9D3M444_ANGAN|nr:hypothetical protein ANANG_G00188390 [Anguilla anguilla]